MLTLILAESELELVPDELQRHRAVVSHAKRRGKKSRHLLLDSSMHHTAMVGLPDKTRRGRPDIVHTFLLVSLESIMGENNQLNAIVHTRHNEVLHFNQNIRLSKNYNRFIGLIEQLFQYGQVPRECLDDSEPLITLENNKTLLSVVTELRNITKENGKELKVVVLSQFGKQVDAREFFRQAGESEIDHLCIIGGFPEGDFNSNMDELHADETISIYNDMLKTWTVASEILVNYRTGKGGE